MTTTTLQNAEEQFTKTVGQSEQALFSIQYAGDGICVVWEVIKDE